MSDIFSAISSLFVLFEDYDHLLEFTAQEKLASIKLNINLILNLKIMVPYLFSMFFLLELFILGTYPSPNSRITPSPTYPWPIVFIRFNQFFHGMGRVTKKYYTEPAVLIRNKGYLVWPPNSSRLVTRLLSENKDEFNTK